MQIIQPLFESVSSRSPIPNPGGIDASRRYTPAIPGTAALPAPYRNTFLAALPPEARESIAPTLDVVRIEVGQALDDLTDPSRYVHFPESAVFSIRSCVGGRQAPAIAVVGCEGLVGLSTALAGEPDPLPAVCEVDGFAVRVAADAFRVLAGAGGPLHERLLGYARSMFLQVSLTAACGTRHTVLERCARWLLAIVDRTPADPLLSTHDTIASALGVRRASISVAVEQMEAAGVLRSRRGKFTVLDRAGLERVACECYGAERRHVAGLA